MPRMDPLTRLATAPTRLPRWSAKDATFSRQDVINAFATAFELIGGVTRLTIWADQNPGEFYRLYSKLLPSTTSQLGDLGKLEIIHSIAPTALDHHVPQTIDVEVTDVPIVDQSL